jgi:hypothetical protein
VRFSEWHGVEREPYDRAVLLRTTIGLGAAAGGLTTLTYGIAQAIENGSCGTDEYGRVIGPPCPDGFGEMIVLMVLGTFVALGGAALASSLLRFILPVTVAVLAGVGLGFLDLNENDTRPGLEIVAAVAAPMVLFTVPFVGRKRGRGFMPPKIDQQVAQSMFAGEPAATTTTTTSEPTFSAGAPQWQQVKKDPEEVAARLRQLEQLKDSGLLDDAAYAEQRKRILSEL